MNRRFWILSVLVSYFLITGATFIGGGSGGGGLSGLTANQVMFATGASSIGGSSLFTFDGTVSPNMRITPSASNRVALQLIEPGTTSGPSIGGYPPLLSLGTVDGGSFYSLGYSTGSGGTLRQWANWLDDATGNLTFDSIASNGALLARVSLTADGSLLPTGLTASQLVATNSNKKLVSTTAPTISDFTSATHTHTNSAGGGQLAEGALSLTDITTNNATTSKHGFLPKLSGTASDVLKGDGTFGAAGISVTCTVMPTAMTITAGAITSVTGGTCS